MNNNKINIHYSKYVSDECFDGINLFKYTKKLKKFIK